MEVVYEEKAILRRRTFLPLLLLDNRVGKHFRSVCAHQAKEDMHWAVKRVMHTLERTGLGKPQGMT